MPEEITRTEELKISFAGDAVSKDETISLELFQSKKTSVKVSIRDLGVESITIPKARLAGFGPGEVKMQLVRLFNQDFKGSGQPKGERIGKYETSWRQVKLVD